MSDTVTKRAPKRYLILAEGRSGDPHYGKTARGVIRYAPDPTVALLDSTRAGETQDEIPIVGSVDKALRFEPTTAIVGVATQGGRFPLSTWFARSKERHAQRAARSPVTARRVAAEA